MDGVRVTFAFMGIMFHMAFWYILNPEQLVSVKTFDYSKDFFWITKLVPLFRMDSFFLIAGFFTAMSLAKYEFRAFLKKRVVNLYILNIVPIVFIVTTLISYLIQLSIGSIGSLGPLSPLYWKSLLFEHHLWFLEILFIYYIIYGLLLRKSGFVNFMQNKVQSVHILLLGFVYLLWAFLAKLLPILWSDNFLVDTIYRTFIYFPYFMLGAVMYFNIRVANSFMRLSLVRILVFFVFIFTYLYFVNKQYGVIGVYDEPVFTLKLITYLAKGFASLGAVYLVFLTSSHIFRKDSKLLKYLSDRSYTVYLLHFPFCLIFGYLFTKINLDVRLEYVIAVFSIYIITLLMHDVLIRIVKLKTIELKVPLAVNTINS